MIKYACDICGSNCSSTKYMLPIYKQVGFKIGPDGGPIYGFEPEEYNLCDTCCSKIFSRIREREREK